MDLEFSRQAGRAEALRVCPKGFVHFLRNRRSVTLSPNEEGAWSIRALPFTEMRSARGTSEGWLRLIVVEHAHALIPSNDLAFIGEQPTERSEGGDRPPATPC